MKLFKHEPPPPLQAASEPAPEELVPAEPPIEIRVGTLFCSSRGCSEETGIACAYVDRRERKCPTAWCPEHRKVSHDDVYCPTHGRLVDGTSDDFGEHAHVDLENRVPNLISWAAQELEEDITAMMERLCAEYHEKLVIDPVRFVLVGVERVRTWERAWKMCAHIGVSLRVTVAVEEADPSKIHGRVNSKPVIELATPWHPDHGFGAEPSSPEQMDAVIADFHRAMFMALARRAETWHQAEPPPEEPAQPDPAQAGWDAYGQPAWDPSQQAAWDQSQQAAWGAAQPNAAWGPQTAVWQQQAPGQAGWTPPPTELPHSA